MWVGFYHFPLLQFLINIVIWFNYQKQLPILSSLVSPVRKIYHFLFYLVNTAFFNHKKTIFPSVKKDYNFTFFYFFLFHWRVRILFNGVCDWMGVDVKGKWFSFGIFCSQIRVTVFFLLRWFSHDFGILFDRIYWCFELRQIPRCFLFVLRLEICGSFFY